MARLEEVLPALREGKRIRKDRDIVYLDGGELFYTDEHGYKEPYFMDSDGLFFTDWEVVPEPTHVADYFVPAKYVIHHRLIKHFQLGWGSVDAWFHRQTHLIGSPPEGSVLVPGTERDEHSEVGE